MKPDPIVEEVRLVRDQLAREFNYDIHAIFADLRTRERAADPAHPLVANAEDWMQSAESLVVREEQPKPGE